MKINPCLNSIGILSWHLQLCFQRSHFCEARESVWVGQVATYVSPGLASLSALRPFFFIGYDTGREGFNFKVANRKGRKKSLHFMIT